MPANINHFPMAVVVADLKTKSDKIRSLTAAGYSRTEIADFLRIRYQHVRNVQVQDERVGRAGPPIQPPIQPPLEPSRPKSDARERADQPIRRLVEDGRVALPEAMRTALGLKDGDPVVVRLEDDGIHIVSLPVAVRRAQEIVRRYVPQGVSLSDEMAEDGSPESVREEGNA